MYGCYTLYINGAYRWNLVSSIVGLETYKILIKTLGGNSMWNNIKEFFEVVLALGTIGFIIWASMYMAGLMIEALFTLIFF